MYHSSLFRGSLYIANRVEYSRLHKASCKNKCMVVLGIVNACAHIRREGMLLLNIALKVINKKPPCFYCISHSCPFKLRGQSKETAFVSPKLWQIDCPP